MTVSAKPSALTLVAELLGLSARAATLLVELRVGCLGCSMNRFCTLEDMCREYGVDLGAFLAALQTPDEANDRAKSRSF